MFKWIKNWYFGYVVCKKYGLKFKPLFTSKIGGCLHWNKSKSGFNKISASIGSCIFNEILMHEVGHFMDFKASVFAHKYPTVFIQCTEHWDEEERDFIYREAKASRYALRLLKSTGNLTENSYKVLSGSRCFGSYIKSIWVGSNSNGLKNKIALADIDYKLCKYISGK